MDGLQWKTLLKCMIWGFGGYHYFWKHPHPRISQGFRDSYEPTRGVSYKKPSRQEAQSLVYIKVQQAAQPGDFSREEDI